MDAENQNPTPPNQTDPSQSNPISNPLPSSPLGGSNAPAQHPLDAPATRSVDSLNTPPSQPSTSQVLTPQSSSPTQHSYDRPTALSDIAGAFSGVASAVFSWVIFPIAVVLILHNFVFQAYHVLGTSMVSTLHESDYLIISKLGYTQALIERTFGHNKNYIPARGQIIVFRYPKDPTKVFVKRVIGLPGDRVVVKSGTVTIYDKSHPNGFNPDTKYEKSDTQTLIDTDEVVQEGNVFVMGDNRSVGGSYDSREWGELPSSYIIGNAVLRLLPLDQVKIL